MIIVIFINIITATKIVAFVIMNTTTLNLILFHVYLVD